MISDLLTKGLDNYNKGKYDEAIALFNQAHKEDPSNSICIYNIATCYHMKKDYAKAVENYKAAIKLNPNYFLAYKSLGNLHFDNQKNDLALECYEKCLTLSPEDERSCYLTGLIYFEKKIYLKAVEYFEKAASLAQKSETYNQLGSSYFSLYDYEQALKYFQKAIELEPNNDLYKNNLNATRQSINEFSKYQSKLRLFQFNEKGNSFFRYNDFDQAVYYYKKALAEDTNDATIYKNLAASYKSKNDDYSALDAYLKALLLDKNDAQTVNDLGCCYLRLNEVGRAVEAFEKAVLLDPSDTVFKKNLDYAREQKELSPEQIRLKKEAIVLNEKGTELFNQLKFQEAADYYKRSLSLDPDVAVVNYNLSNTYYNLKLFTDIFRYVNRAIELEPLNTTYMQLLGNAYAKTGEFQNAVDIFRRALAIKENALIYNDLGTCYHSNHFYSQAVDCFSKASNLNPAEEVFKNNLKTALANEKLYSGIDPKTIGHLVKLNESAVAAFNQGNYSQAITLFQQFLGKLPDDSLTIYNLATCYLSTKDYDIAIEHYNRALLINPGYALAAEALGNSYSGKGDLKNAFLAYQNALKINPAQLGAIKGLAYYYYKIQDYKKSIELSLSALDQGLKDSETFNQLGFCYFKLKSFIRASEYFQKALDLEPGNNTYKINLSEAISEKEKYGDSLDISDRPSLDEILVEVNSMIGLENIKNDIDTLTKYTKIEKLRMEKGLSKNPVSMHTVFLGPPGTGKTTVARLLGKIYLALGVLSRGHVVEVDRSQLVASFMGQTAPKTNEMIDKALGGILFIDEAYTLSKSDGADFGKEAIDTLLKRMEDDRDKFMVVVAGYNEPMQKFLTANPGLRSRFNRFFYFQDYKPLELLEIFKRFCKNNKFNLLSDAEQKLQRYFKYAYETKDENFGNARLVRNTFENIIRAQSIRLSDLGEIPEDELSKLTLKDTENALADVFQEATRESLEEVLNEVQSLIGLDNVKQEISALVNFINVEKIRFKQGLVPQRLSLHFVFQGPPGTGKTTVARLLGKIFKAMGIIEKGHVIEVDRSQLIGQFVGQTAPKTNAVIDSALNGILFIDEAYTLNTSGGSNDFGSEAVATLLKRMEDDRNRLIVVVAGYPQDMDNFIKSNAGLQSRFNRYLNFNDYTPPELYRIFSNFCFTNKYKIREEASATLQAFLEQLYLNRDNKFGNGRTVRNIYEKIVEAQANRISTYDSISNEALVMIENEDVINSLKYFSIQKKEDKKRIGF